MSRVRRSVHFVPGANEKMLEKSLATNADSLVLDLEDAVTPENKDDARATICSWLADVDFGRQERVIRINPCDSPWFRADLEATMVNPPDAYLTPKINSPGEVALIDRIVTDLERLHGHEQGAVKLLVLGTETPRGLLNIGDLVCAERVDALTWGAEDLSAAIGARRNRDDAGRYLPLYGYARIMTMISAAAAGVQPLDTVYVDVTNADGLREECVEGATMGFTGKISIHPTQIDVINETFSPSAEEIDESRELLAELERHRAEGRMAFRFRGNMVDVPHFTRAQRILDLADRLAES